MLSLIKRVLGTAIAIALMAAPAAYARPDQSPITLPDSIATPLTPAVSAAPHTPVSSSSSFRWGDAGVGAGGLLVLIIVGTGAAVVYRRRAHRPLAS